MPETNLDIESLKSHIANGLIGSRILYFDSLPSTMDRAKAEAEMGAPESTVIVADEQTRGRGRFDRHWLSPKGYNLLFSIILRPNVDQLNQMNMAASLSVARVIAKLTGNRPTIKWPNDVRIGGKKAAGILIESVMDNRSVRYAVVGIGVNVNWRPPDDAGLAYPATSLADEIDRLVSRTSVLKAILQEMDALYAQVKAKSSLRKEWSELLDTLGKHVKIGAGQDIQEGVAKDIDESGNLILVKPDGSTLTVAAGEVTLQA